MASKTHEAKMCTIPGTSLGFIIKLPLNEKEKEVVKKKVYTEGEEMTEYTEEQIDNMTGRDISRVLKKQPELFDNFTREQIDKMDGVHISWVLWDQSELFDKFTPKQIDKMDGTDISLVLRDQPWIFDKFTPKQIDKMDWISIRNLLRSHPRLSLLFNKEKDGIAEDFDKARIYVKCLLDPRYYTKLNEKEKEVVKKYILKEKK